MTEGQQNRWDYVKQKTRDLYLTLPQDKKSRMSRIDIRDEVIELNYTFFGYVASHTYINNTSISYEDKFQSALGHFCEIWWTYLWQGDETHKGYRQDLSFAVFFKPRIGEMIERELNEVKYSVRRSLCMEVGAMIGKHWGKVTYEDLSDPRVKLPADKMNSLKAIFGTVYVADLEDHLIYMEAPKTFDSIDSMVKVEYNDIEELLIQEMIQTEEKLDEKHLQNMAEVYQIEIEILREKLPAAEDILYHRLMSRLDVQDTF